MSLFKMRELADDALRVTGVGGIAVAVLTAVGGGVALSTIQTRWPDYAESVLYGVVGSAMILASIAAVKYLKSESRVRSSNIEHLVRNWGDRLGYAVQRRHDDRTLFSYDLRNTSGVAVTVARPKRLDHFLVFKTRLTLSAAQIANQQARTPEQIREMIRDLRMELNRMQMDYSALANPVAEISVNNHALITNELTEHMFLLKVQSNVHAATLLAQVLDKHLSAVPERTAPVA